MTAEDTTNQRGRSPFVPLLILSTAFLTLLTFQTLQLYRDYGGLQELEDAQQQPLEEAQRLRTQLDGVAADTARLAEQGNANARRVIDELRKRGITVNPGAASATAPSAVE